MKWDRALSALIIIFMMINIYLGVANYGKYIAIYHVDERQMEAIKALLKEREIEVMGDIPYSFRPVESILLNPLKIESEERNKLVEIFLDEQRKDIVISKKSSTTPYEHASNIYRKEDKILTFQGNYFNYEDQGILLDEGMVDKKEALNMVDTFLNEKMSDYLFEKAEIDYRIESYGATITYYEVYGRLPIYNSYIKVKVTEEGIARIEIEKVETIQREPLVKPIRSINEILFSIEQYIPKQVPYTIESIELGYRIENDETLYLLEEEAIPVYKINVKGLDEVLFVNAYIK